MRWTSDAGLFEVIQVQMIGADGARTDKAHLAALEQSAIDVGHRTHQQNIGLLDRGAVDGTTRYPADFAETLEEGIEQGIFSSATISMAGSFGGSAV